MWRVHLVPSQAAQSLLAPLQRLYGHQGAVTCLAHSAAYSIVVSGSRDATCIVWDVNRREFIRQLGPADGGGGIGAGPPVRGVAIGQTTGNIMACAGTVFHLWSINGDLLVRHDCITAGGNNTILCCAMTEGPEWDRANVLITGHDSGSIKVRLRAPPRSSRPAVRAVDRRAGRAAGHAVAP